VRSGIGLFISISVCKPRLQGTVSVQRALPFERLIAAPASSWSHSIAMLSRKRGNQDFFNQEIEYAKAASIQLHHQEGDGNFQPASVCPDEFAGKINGKTQDDFGNNQVEE
jgi:hypothetical protein